MNTLEEMELYAETHYVPIARKECVRFLIKLIQEKKYYDVLEIGSAIGYTTVQLALLDDVYVTTIEYDEVRYKLCQENIKDFHVENKVVSILDDALHVFLSLKYDLIFIDAAKAKNIMFFEKFSANLKKDGCIIIDNLLLNDFRKRVSPKKVEFYDHKIEELKEYLESLEDFDVQYANIGDGIAIIKRKG